VELGSDGDANLQHVVRGSTWFASTVKNEDSYSLVGCTVAPGFNFNQFHLAKREDLLSLYPQHASIIEKLTRG
jgi:hypothetical protein